PPPPVSRKKIHWSRRETRDAAVRDRARRARRSLDEPGRGTRARPQVRAGPDRSRAPDPVDPELRHREQGLLHLPRAGRGDDPRARAPGGYTRESRGRGAALYAPLRRRRLNPPQASAPA